MPIPNFIDNYFLPPGEHECTLKEIEEIFLIQNNSQARENEWSNFKFIINKMITLNISPSIILIDGSFVTKRKKIGDVDFVCLIKPQKIKNALNNSNNQFDQNAIYMLYNSKFKDIVRSLFGAHSFVVPDKKSLDQWSNFFQQTKTTNYNRDPSWVNPPNKKGILKIDLRKEGYNGKL